MRSAVQERTYSLILPENQSLRALGTWVPKPGEVTSQTLRMEVLTQEYDKMQRKPSVAESFKLGINVSNFMVNLPNQKRGFYRSNTVGSSRHMGTTLTDQELIFSLTIPGEDSIIAKEVGRGFSMGNKFLQKK